MKSAAPKYQRKKISKQCPFLPHQCTDTTTFTATSTYYDHIQREHQTNWEEFKMKHKTYSCDECGHKAVSQDSLRKHKCSQQLVLPKTKTIAKANIQKPAKAKPRVTKRSQAKDAKMINNVENVEEEEEKEVHIAPKTPVQEFHEQDQIDMDETITEESQEELPPGKQEIMSDVDVVEHSPKEMIKSSALIPDQSIDDDPMMGNPLPSHQSHPLLINTNLEEFRPIQYEIPRQLSPAEVSQQLQSKISSQNVFQPVCIKPKFQSKLDFFTRINPGVSDLFKPNPAMALFTALSPQASMTSNVLNINHSQDVLPQMDVYSSGSLFNQPLLFQKQPAIPQSEQNYSLNSQFFTESLKRLVITETPSVAHLEQNQQKSNKLFNRVYSQEEQSVAGDRINEIDSSVKEKDLKEALNSMLLNIKKDSAYQWGNIHQVKPKDLQNKLKHRHVTRAHYNLELGVELRQSKAQIGYGEITQGGVEKVMSSFYKLGFSKDSIFLDLGSGFGQVNFQVALLHQCRSVGIEIVSNRVDFCVEKLRSYKIEYSNFKHIVNALDQIEFYCYDIETMQSLITPTQMKLTHVYVFDTVMSMSTRQSIVKLINQSPWVEALAWTQTSKTTLVNLGLQNFELFQKHRSVGMQGGKGSFNFYVYSKVKAQQRTTGSMHDEEEEKKLYNSYQSSESVIIIKNPNIKNRWNNSRPRQIVGHQQNELSEISDTSDDQDLENDYNCQFNRTEDQSISKGEKQSDFQRCINHFQNLANDQNKYNQGLEYALSQLNPQHKYIKKSIVQQYKIKHEISIDNIDIALISKQSLVKLTKEQVNLLQRTIDNYNFSLKREGLIKQLLGQITQLHHQEIEMNGELGEDLNVAYKEIDELTKWELEKKYLKVESLIGSGSYGRVYKCQCLPGNVLFKPQKDTIHVAVKVPVISQTNPNNELNQLQILNRTKDPSQRFVVKLLNEVPFLNDYVALVLEYYPFELRKVMKEGLNPKQVAFISYGIIKAVAFAHKMNIAHLDIKPENILMDDRWVPKLCDWGMANTNGEGTYGYQAPEIQQVDITVAANARKLDSWALGITLYQVASKGRLPASKDQLIDMMKHCQEISLSDDIENPQTELLKIVKQLLCFNPKDRILPQDALMSSIFEKMPQQFKQNLDVSLLH